MCFFRDGTSIISLALSMASTVAVILKLKLDGSFSQACHALRLAALTDSESCGSCALYASIQMRWSSGSSEACTSVGSSNMLAYIASASFSRSRWPCAIP